MSLTWIALLGMALAKGPPARSVLKEKIDLNGDGRADKLEVLASEGQGGLQAVKVVVNGVSLADIQMYKELAVSIVDVNTADKNQQILVDGTSESGKKWFTFFIWDGKKVISAMKVDTGSPNGAYKLIDSGQVIIEKPRGFWTERAIWKLAGFKFDEISQPFFAVGKAAFVESPIVLVYEPNTTGPVTEVGGGTSVDIILCTRGDKPWYLLKTDTGLLGWIDGREIGESIKPGDPPSADEG
jgi:hypothetical protein